MSNIFCTCYKFTHSHIYTTYSIYSTGSLIQCVYIYIAGSFTIIIFYIYTILITKFLFIYLFILHSCNVILNSTITLFVFLSCKEKNNYLFLCVNKNVSMIFL